MSKQATTHTTDTDPQPILDPSALYLGDKGRCHCGKPRCAGFVAAYMGKGLVDGKPVVRVTARMLLGHPDWTFQDVERLTCEGCDQGLEMDVVSS